MAGIVRQDDRIFKIFKKNPENHINPVILWKTYSENSLAYFLFLARPKLV